MRRTAASSKFRGRGLMMTSTVKRRTAAASKFGASSVIELLIFKLPGFLLCEVLGAVVIFSHGDTIVTSFLVCCRPCSDWFEDKMDLLYRRSCSFYI